MLTIINGTLKVFKTHTASIKKYNPYKGNKVTPVNMTENVR